jgi:hypothetical protein
MNRLGVRDVDIRDTRHGFNRRLIVDRIFASHSFWRCLHLTWPWYGLRTMSRSSTTRFTLYPISNEAPPQTDEACSPSDLLMYNLVPIADGSARSSAHSTRGSNNGLARQVRPRLPSRTLPCKALTVRPSAGKQRSLASSVLCAIASAMHRA